VTGKRPALLSLSRLCGRVCIILLIAAGFIAEPVLALSLGGLRRRIEALMLPDTVDVRLILDRRARLVRDQRRRGGESRMGDYGR
jgi:hypothetical protein